MTTPLLWFLKLAINQRFLKDSDKENSKNKDYVSAYIKEQNVKKSKGVGMAEDLAVAGGGASTVGIATFGISKLVKTSGNDKNNKPSTDSAADPNPEPNNSKDPDDDSAKREKDVESFKKEKAGEFLAWSVKALLIIYIVQTIIRMIILEIQQRESDRIYFYLNSEEDENIKPFFGLWKNFTNKDRFEVDGYYSKFTTNCSGLRRVGINAIAALTLAKYDWINSNKS